jgi:HlyD family secretion protein
LARLTSLSAIRGREATAWTIEDGRLQQRQVTLGQHTLDGRAEITGGLPEGARLVDGPVAGLVVGRRAMIVAEKRQ